MEMHSLSTYSPHGCKTTSTKNLIITRSPIARALQTRNSRDTFSFSRGITFLSTAKLGARQRYSLTYQTIFVGLTTMSTSTQPTFKARLNYALPFSPEIRNQIYHYVLNNPGHIPLEPSEEKESKSFPDSDERKWAEKGAGPDPRPLQLLLLSR